MTRAKDISKIVSDANFGGTLDVGGAFTSLGIDDNANATAITIDSSENVLVGTTTVLTAESNVEGISLASGSYGGLLSVSRASARSATFNRKTNDGDIVQFRKDGTAVGSIGVLSNRLYAGTDDTGLFFSNTTNGIHPWNTTSNSARDAGIDLGNDSRRFKDLYLSGGVVFDAVSGNATSNTLDDYEEGTWTPALTDETTAVYSIQSGWYRKIGNTVYIYFSIWLSSKGNISGSYTRIGSLPFTGSPTARFGSGQIHAYRINSAKHIQGIEFGGSVGTVGWIMTGGGTTSGYLNTSFVADNTYFEGFGIYRTA